MNLADRKVIVFDGNCSLCSWWVDFVIKRNKKKDFLFCALQSKTGQKISTHFLKNEKSLESVIFIDHSKLYLESSAALHIFKYLDGPWKFFFVFISFPKFIRNFIYRIIARNRYKWWKKRAICYAPKKGEEKLFLK